MTRNAECEITMERIRSPHLSVLLNDGIQPEVGAAFPDLIKFIHIGDRRV